jgi:hypothetical protein
LRGDPSNPVIISALGDNEIAAPVNRYSERVREYGLISWPVGKPYRPGTRDRNDRPDRVAPRDYRARLNPKVDY